MAKYEIHISDVRAFKSCRRRWYFSSPLQRNLEPIVPYMPFLLGRAVHEAEENMRKEGMPLDAALDVFTKREVEAIESKNGKLWEQERATIEESLDLARGMLEHYAKWASTYKGRWAEDQFEFVASETEFSVPLYNPSGHKSTKVFLAGRFDGLVVRKDDGSFWIWETKTSRSIKELERSLQNDEQCGAYIYAAQQLFKVHVTGVLYNIMRKKVPTEPMVLQSGMLSKNKSIDTTAEAYAAAVKRNHPDWRVDTIMEFYGDILDTLLAKENEFFKRVAVYRTEAEIQQLQSDLWAVALEMTRRQTPHYPTPTWMNCNFCRFRAPCLAMNAQADVEFILENEYQEREQAFEVLASETKEE
jgi:hypothetical protein